MAKKNRNNREQLPKVVQAYTNISCSDKEAMADVFSQYDPDIQAQFLDSLKGNCKAEDQEY